MIIPTFSAVSIEVTPSSTLLIGSDITVSCIVNITIEARVAQVVWTDQDFNLLNIIDGNLTGSELITDNIMLSLDLMINDVQVSNAGVVYTCYTIIIDHLDDVATTERQYTLTVESKSLFIIIVMGLLLL